MSDNDTRWADQLLERARARAAPHAEDAARNLASIEARLGFGPGIAADSPRETAARIGRVEGGLTRSGAANGALRKSAFVKGSLVLAFGVGTGVIGYLIGRAETERTRDPIADRAPAAAMPDARAGEHVVRGTTEIAANATDVPPIPEAPVAPASSDAVPVAAPPAAHAAAVRRPRVARPAAPVSARPEGFELSDALELLRRAEAAVRRSDGLEARMWLSDLDRRAPPQLLLEERLVTRALADCLVDDVDAGRATLRELEASNPESIYRARLEGSCVADQMRVADRMHEH